MELEFEPKLKPLYANLKRLKIGDYLYTKEFELYILENNLDTLWGACKRKVSSKSHVVFIGRHFVEDDEEAFMYLMSTWYTLDYPTFHIFILPILINFARWHQTKLDFNSIIDNLKELGMEKENVLKFIRDFRKIQEAKPIKAIDSKQKKDIKSSLPINSKKVFVVHGRDDKSRLELCNILKEDFKLEPIVLQEKPNNSIETVITKFERLASDCSAAVVIFTPDDVIGENNKRARQNVIFELGYFLGKFQDDKTRKIIILKKGNIEIPSDISGVLYLEYNNAVKEAFYDLKKQFEYWGYNL